MGNEVKWGSQKWGENGEGDKMGKPKMGKKWGMGQNGEAKIVYRPTFLSNQVIQKFI
jgi:hypothetical protein